MQKVATTYRINSLTSPEGLNELVYSERPANMADLLDDTASKCGDREALIKQDVRLSYKQFAFSVSCMASALYHRFGVRKGDRVALMLRNSVEFVVSLFANARIGAITVPLNTALKGEELSFQLNDSGATVLIVEPDFYELIAEIRPLTKGVKHIFVTGGKPAAGTGCFSELLEDKNYAPVKEKMDETDGLVIMYTSGTTGKPKGALLSHRGVIASAMNAAHLCGSRPGRDKMLIIVPLFHITGVAMALTSAIYTGIPVIIAERFKAAEALKTIEAERITTIVAVPTMFWLMLNAPEFSRHNLSSLRFLAAGGAAVPDDVVKACVAKLPGVQFAPGYGLTEASGITHSIVSLEEALSKPGSVGRVMPLLDASVVDSAGKELSPGEIGELLIRGCQVMKEYWHNPKATQETITGGWLHTGDIARITEDGYTYILDRKKDMINRGGEKIFSIEVENILYRNPKVLEAAIVAVPDKVFGEQIKAVLVLKPGERATAEEIQHFCRQHLAEYKVPRYVEFREILPRNPAGKVIKDRLK